MSAMDLEKIRKSILKGEDIEALVKDIHWSEFERVCSEILEKHDFSVKRNFRFKTRNRYEIDILAKRGNKVLLIDCKHWAIRPGSKSLLRIAAEKQKERENEYQKILFLDSKPLEKTFPLLITLFQESIIKANGVWVVPVYMLNSFMLDIENYLE